MDNRDLSEKGTVTCTTWIRRPENGHLVVLGKSSPSSLEIFSFDPETTFLSPFPKVKFEFEEGVNPMTIAVHPSGDDVVCSTSTGGCTMRGNGSSANGVDGLVAAACGQLDTLLKKGATKTCRMSNDKLVIKAHLYENPTNLANGSLDAIYCNGNGLHVCS